MTLVLRSELILLVSIYAALGIALLAVFKMRRLKAQVILERKQDIQELLAAIGEIESLEMARGQAAWVSNVMQRYGVTALVLPLKSGGKVGFSLEASGLRVSPATELAA
jgi:hypothetical protein